MRECYFSHLRLELLSVALNSVNAPHAVCLYTSPPLKHEFFFACDSFMTSAKMEYANSTLTSYLEKLDQLCSTPLRPLSTNRPRTSGLKAGSPLDTANGLVDEFCATKKATEFEKLSLAFKCLYLSTSGQNNTAELVKKHQHYVVYLSSKKLYERALDELACLFNVLSSLPLSNEVSYETLLHGISPESESTFDIRLIVSFHFFVIQSVLQMVSIEAQTIAKNTGAERTSVAWAAAKLFLHGSNFDLCLLRFDASAVRKYYSNGLKMLSGFVKVASYIHTKSHDDQWNQILHAFQLKVVEYSLMLDREIVQDIPTCTSMSLVPFYNDLKNVSERTDNANKKLQDIFKETPLHILSPITSKVPTLLISEPKNQSTLMTPKIDVNDNNSVVKFLKNASLCPETINIIVSILKSMKTVNASISQTSILEDCIRLLKPSKITAAIFSQCLNELIPLLSESLKSIHSKDLRTVSRLCFELAKKHSDLEGYQVACETELSYRKIFDSNEDEKASISRIEFSISALMDGGETVQAVRLTKEYTRLVPCAQYSNIFPELIARCLILDSNSVSCFFGETSSLGNANQCNLFQDILLPLKSELSSEKYSLINEIIRKLPMESQLAAQYHASKVFPSVSCEYNPDTLCVRSDHILAAGLQLNISLNEGFDLNCLETVEDHLILWLKFASESDLARHFTVFHDIVVTLSHLGLFDTCINLINRFKDSKFNDNRGLLDMEILLGRCLLEVPRMSLLPNSLKASSILFKTLYSGKFSDYDELLNLKMTHLEYAVKMRDESTSSKKFEEIKSMMASRAEYGLTEHVPHLSVRNRISCFVTVARLSSLSAMINMMLGKVLETLKNSRVSVKLLASVLRRLENTNTSLNDTLNVRRLLIRSHKQAFKAAKHMGLSKEAVHHVKELAKVNALLCNCPLKTFNNFVSAHYLAHASYEAEAQEQFEMGYRSPWKSTTLRLTRLLAHMSLNPDQISDHCLRVIKENMCVFMSEIENTGNENSFVVCASEISDLVLDVESLVIQKTGEGFTGIPQYEQNVPEMLTRIIFQARLKMKESTSHLARDDAEIPESVGILPYRETDPSNPAKPSGRTNSDLSACKKLIKRCLHDSTIEHIDVNTMHDMSFLLARCVSLFSRYDLENQSEIQDLSKTALYVKDVAQSLPFSNQKALLSYQNVNETPSLLPALGSDEHKVSFEDNQETFYQDLRQLLPPTWTVALLDICQISGNLIVSRLDASTDFPLMFDIPFDRRSEQRMEFQQLQKELQSIIQDSNRSTKADVTSTVRTKEDRRLWWSKRFELDSRLERLLSRIETKTVGGLSGIFGSFASDIRYQDFKASLNKVWQTQLESPSLVLDDTIAQLYYHVCSCLENTTFDLEILHDLTNVTIKKLMPEKTVTQEDLCWIIDSISKIGISHQIHNDTDHLVLIPSHSCSQIPWESMSFLRKKSVSRMPSVSPLLDTLKAQNHQMTIQKQDSQSVLYVLNPGSDLKKTQTRFEPILEKVPHARGLAGQCPTEDWLTTNLFNSYLYVYLGHGGGEQYMRTSALFKSKSNTQRNLPATLLMGCSSLAHRENGRLQPTSNMFNWLVCGAPAVMTNLWDITDKDIDIFTLMLLSEWGLTQSDTTKKENKSLSRAMPSSREACTLKYLNGAAPILHGIPLKLR